MIASRHFNPHFANAFQSAAFFDGEPGIGVCLAHIKVKHEN